MARYEVSFDGRRQESFAEAPAAIAWAAEVSETGRRVFVTRRGWLRPSLVAVFPFAELEEGRAEFDRQRIFWGGGTAGPL